MRKCFITTVIGDDCAKIAKLTLPLMRIFAERHGYEFFTLTELFGHAGPHWVRLECKKYLEGDFELCLYSDIDIVFEDGAPDLLDRVDRAVWDVAGAEEPRKAGWTLDVANYAEKSGLPWPLPKTDAPYICSGLALYNRGFLKYFDEPVLPEVKGNYLNDQNALNYAIASGRINCGLLPRGWGSCLDSYSDNTTKRFFYHFHGASEKESQFKRLSDKVRQVNSSAHRRTDI